MRSQSHVQSTRACLWFTKRVTLEEETAQVDTDVIHGNTDEVGIFYVLSRQVSHPQYTAQ